MSAIGLQKRLYGGTNRILWRADDLPRLAKHFGYTGLIPVAPARRGGAPLVMDLSAKIERSAEEPSIYLFTISTGATDLMNDQIAVNGWDLAVFKANPIVQYAHMGDMLPIGHAISVGVETGRLKSRMVFSSDGFARRVQRMVDERTLRGASVGFVPGRDWKFSSDSTRPHGIDFVSGHKLLEWSIVNTPANPQCLFQGSGAADSFRSIRAAAPIGPTPYADAARIRLTSLRSAPTSGSGQGVQAMSRRLEEIKARATKR